MRISDWSSDVCSSDLKRGESPFSTDANLLHTSSEGKVLEDPWEETPDYVYSRTVNPEDAPDTPEYIIIDFERGDGVALNGQRSEEHTSELQSLMRISYAVFCLKKKNKYITNIILFTSITIHPI